MTRLKVTKVKETETEEVGEPGCDVTTKVKLEPETDDSDIEFLKIKESGESEYRKGDIIQIDRTEKQSSLGGD